MAVKAKSKVSVAALDWWGSKSGFMASCRVGHVSVLVDYGASSLHWNVRLGVGGAEVEPGQLVASCSLGGLMCVRSSVKENVRRIPPKHRLATC